MAGIRKLRKRYQRRQAHRIAAFNRAVAAIEARYRLQAALELRQRELIRQALRPYQLEVIGRLRAEFESVTRGQSPADPSLPAPAATIFIDGKPVMHFASAVLRRQTTEGC